MTIELNHDQLRRCAPDCCAAECWVRSIPAQIRQGRFRLFAVCGSQPEFWWGLLFVYVFFFQIGVAPAPLGSFSPMTTPPEPFTGFVLLDSLIAGSPSLFVEALHQLMLPVATLVFVLSGPIVKMVRQNMVRACNRISCCTAIVSACRGNGLRAMRFGLPWRRR